MEYGYWASETAHLSRQEQQEVAAETHLVARAHVCAHVRIPSPAPPRHTTQETHPVQHSVDGRALFLVDPNLAEPLACAREFLLDLGAEPKHLCVRASARVFE